MEPHDHGLDTGSSTSAKRGSADSETPLPQPVVTRSPRQATRSGPDAIDAYSRLPYSEFAFVENIDNCIAFLDRAVAWF